MHVHSVQIDCWMNPGLMDWPELAAEDSIFGGLACVWSRHPRGDKDISRREAASILTLHASIVASHESIQVTIGSLLRRMAKGLSALHLHGCIWLNKIKTSNFANYEDREQVYEFY
jgi:hypothetical protein